MRQAVTEHLMFPLPLTFRRAARGQSDGRTASATFMFLAALIIMWTGIMTSSGMCPTLHAVPLAHLNHHPVVPVFHACCRRVLLRAILPSATKAAGVLIFLIIPFATLQVGIGLSLALQHLPPHCKTLLTFA